jgi:hypothetical protein
MNIMQRINCLIITGAILLSLTVPQIPHASITPKEVKSPDVTIPFIPNRGQFDPSVAYVAPTSAGTVFVSRQGELIYRLQPQGAKENGTQINKANLYLSEAMVGGCPQLRPGDASAVRSNFFIGSNPSRWRSNIAAYKSIKLGDVWPGVQLDLIAHGHKVEKVFTLKPGADVSQIRIRLKGASRLSLKDDGAMSIVTPLGEVKLSPPVAWQMETGVRKPVTIAYHVESMDYGFTLGSYNPALPVVIDPIIQATYLGGGDEERGYGVAVFPDRESPHFSEVYVAGYTQSLDFPVGTTPGYSPDQHSGRDVFVARFNRTLTELLSVAFIGGTGADYLGGPGGGAPITIHLGKVYLTGYTNSGDFPIPTASAIQGTKSAAEDAFVARLSPDLASLERATHLGSFGLDAGWTIAGDPDSSRGNYLYITGHTTSANFPGTTGGYDETYSGSGNDIFVARLHPDLEPTGPDYLKATYLGDASYDRAYGVAVAPATGDVYVTGETESTTLRGGLSASPAAAQETYAGGGDAYVASFSPDLSQARNITYVGGTGRDDGSGIAIDPESGDVFITGKTSSTDLLTPLLAANAAQPELNGDSDAFVTRLDPALTAFQYATYLGGSTLEAGYALALSPVTEDVYVLGNTDSTDFPGTGPDDTNAGSGDAFVAQITPDFRYIGPSGYLGGSGQEMGIGLAINPELGEVYVTGLTASQDFPQTSGGAQPAHGGGQGPVIWWRDAYAARLPPHLNDTVHFAASPAQYDFGRMLAGGGEPHTATAEFEIFNLGVTDLYFDEEEIRLSDTASFTLDFDNADNACGSLPFELARGDSCKVTVTFAPDSIGLYETVLILDPVPGDDAERNVPITGRLTRTWDIETIDQKGKHDIDIAVYITENVEGIQQDIHMCYIRDSESGFATELMYARIELGEETHYYNVQKVSEPLKIEKCAIAVDGNNMPHIAYLIHDPESDGPDGICEARYWNSAQLDSLVSIRAFGDIDIAVAGEYAVMSLYECSDWLSTEPKCNAYYRSRRLLEPTGQFYGYLFDDYNVSDDRNAYRTDIVVNTYQGPILSFLMNDNSSKVYWSQEPCSTSNEGLICSFQDRVFSPLDIPHLHIRYLHMSMGSLYRLYAIYDDVNYPLLYPKNRLTLYHWDVGPVTITPIPSSHLAQDSMVEYNMDNAALVFVMDDEEMQDYPENCVHAAFGSDFLGYGKFDFNGTKITIHGREVYPDTREVVDESVPQKMAIDSKNLRDQYDRIIHTTTAIGYLTDEGHVRYAYRQVPGDMAFPSLAPFRNRGLFRHETGLVYRYVIGHVGANDSPAFTITDVWLDPSDTRGTWEIYDCDWWAGDVRGQELQPGESLGICLRLSEPYSYGESKTQLVVETDASTVNAEAYGPPKDEDEDGIPDGNEMGIDGSDMTYDGNGDGTPDYLQATVASLPTFDGEHYITIAALGGTSLENVTPVDGGAQIAALDGVEFPFGLFSFDIVGVSGDTAVTMILPEAGGVNSYYMHGGKPDHTDPHWYDFLFDAATGTGAEINENIITLHFVDGGRGDHDLTVDGRISDPGGPVVMADLDSDNDGIADDQDNCPVTPNPDQADADGDGAGDACDNCPNDAGKTEPGACGCGVSDTDADGDGTPDCNDGCPSDPDKTAPGTCGCGIADTDTDGDGTSDCIDGCADDPTKTEPGVCGCGVPDTDADGDGTPDCNDGCPSDPDKTAPGTCGCGIADTDTDGDGTSDCIDGCADDPTKTDPGVCGCGTPDTDTDGDGISDCSDNCADVFNPDQADSDGDGIGDACEEDDTPPNITISVEPSILWPPNHKMVLVSVNVEVSDDEDPDPQYGLETITMNETDETSTFDPNTGTSIGDGNTTNDIQVSENGEIYLRAERSGTGNGRIYTITFFARDSSGNTSSASATVIVPHNQ